VEYLKILTLHDTISEFGKLSSLNSSYGITETYLIIRIYNIRNIIFNVKCKSL